MNNPTTQQSPALRIEAGSINCLVREASFYAANRNLLTVAESLPAHNFDYLFLVQLIILLHIIRRTPRVAVLFTFTNCGMFSSGGKSGDAPWLLLVGGINGNTASVDDASNGAGSSGGSGSGGSALVPVVGMYFLHPDHLGSITMITDGRGNVISGGNNGGKSHISYTPYGSIHRTDSSGPDITRFKFTGQEEDKESGLLYYKARYYDPMLGRFLQADSVVMPESTFGMNRYMYVEGSPVNYRDVSGHRKIGGQEGALIGYVLASQTGSPIPPEYGYYLGAYMASGKHNGKSATKDMSIWNSSKVKSAWNNTAIQRGVAGAFVYNEMGLNPMEGAAIGYFGSDKEDRTSHKRRGLANNDLSHVWDSIKRSDLGTGLTKAWHGNLNFQRELFYGDSSKAIARSDLGRGDLGRWTTRNRGCIYLAFDIVGFVAAVLTDDLPVAFEIGADILQILEGANKVKRELQIIGAYIGGSSSQRDLQSCKFQSF